jgi:hypothetical protein
MRTSCHSTASSPVYLENMCCKADMFHGIWCRRGEKAMWARPHENRGLLTAQRNGKAAAGPEILETGDGKRRPAGPLDSSPGRLAALVAVSDT